MLFRSLLSSKYNYHVPKKDVPGLLIQSALAMMNFDRTEAKRIVNELCDKKADEELEEQLQKTRPLEHELDAILEANGIVLGSSMSIDELIEKYSFPNDEE